MTYSREEIAEQGAGAGALIVVSTIGRAWTAHCEGCRLTAYPDNGACSVGYGHRGVPEGTVWTRAQAEAALDDDLYRAACAVSLQVKVPLNQGQIDALADWVYNLGSHALAGSTLLRELNAGRCDRVPGQMRRWIYSAGLPNNGLVARREGEVVLWNGGNPLA